MNGYCSMFCNSRFFKYLVMSKILVLVFLLGAGNLYSQNISVEYLNTKTGRLCELLINDSIATFDLKKESIAGTQQTAPTSYQINIDQTAGGFLIKNRHEGFLYTDESFVNTVFYVKDTLYSMKWTLTNDTITILGKKALSARTRFRGRDYTAFYSPEMNMPEGPLKFGGLPGLILSIKSDDDYLELKATRLIENITQPIKLPDLLKYKFLSQEEYIKKFKETVLRYTKMVRARSTEANGTFHLKMEALEIIYPEFQTGEGIAY